jgi:hypothetical protein
MLVTKCVNKALTVSFSALVSRSTFKLASGARSLLVAFLIPVCTHAVAAEAPNLIVVTWVGDCELDIRKPYFSIVLTPHDELQFVGFEAVKALGVREVSINGPSAKLTRAAGQFRRVIDAFLKGGPSERGVEGDCLLVERGDTRAEVSTRDPKVRDLNLLVKSTPQLLTLLCPAQMRVPLRAEYCSQPVVSVTYAERASCRLSQTTEIYADGAVHHYILGSNRRYADRIGRIDQLAVESFARSLAQVPDEIAGSPHDFQRRGDEAIQFRRKLQEVTKMSWEESLPIDSTCLSDPSVSGFPIANVGLYN